MQLKNLIKLKELQESKRKYELEKQKDSYGIKDMLIEQTYEIYFELNHEAPELLCLTTPLIIGKNYYVIKINQVDTFYELLVLNDRLNHSRTNNDIMDNFNAEYIVVNRNNKIQFKIPQDIISSNDKWFTEDGYRKLTSYKKFHYINELFCAKPIVIGFDEIFNDFDNYLNGNKSIDDILFLTDILTMGEIFELEYEILPELEKYDRADIPLMNLYKCSKINYKLHENTIKFYYGDISFSKYITLCMK